MPEGIFSVRMKHALYTHCLKALALSPEERCNYGQMHYPCPNTGDDPRQSLLWRVSFCARSAHLQATAHSDPYLKGKIITGSTYAAISTW